MFKTLTVQHLEHSTMPNNINRPAARATAMAKPDEQIIEQVHGCTFSTLTRNCGCIIERITRTVHTTVSGEDIRSMILEKEYPCEMHGNNGGN